jgi:AraC-like DNA-binding protein/mannose-6-phosphate isomerase-like protein (cupin superfamily)
MQTETIDIRTDKELSACLRAERSVAVMAYDYPAGDRVPVHEHAKAQLIYAIEGTMTVSTREGRWVLLPTRAIWIPARMRHAIRMRGQVRMRTVFFDETVPPPAPTCAVVGVSPLLRELIVSMLLEPRAYAPNGRGAHISALICSELHLWQTLPLHLPWPKEPRLRRVCNALQKNPRLNGDMEYWATREGISSRTLARAFRANLGMSFHEWRSQLLLLEAHIRLGEGQSSSRVARALGYASPAAFSAMFRKATRVSPTEQQKQLIGIPGQEPL